MNTIIDSIRIENVNGLTKTIKLPGNRIILAGNNGAGKSTILNSIGFALKGHFGNLSKKDGELWAKIATDNQMIVGLGQGNEYILRGLKRTPKSTKQFGIVDGKDRKKAEIQTAIEGSCFDIEIVSVSTFWTLSDAKQILELSKFYTGDDYSADTINAKFPDEFKSTGSNQIELLAAIEDKIKKAKTASSAIVQTSDKSILIITDEKNSIERPAGTLLAIQTDLTTIKTTANQINVNLIIAIENKTKLENWQKEVDENEKEIQSIISANSDLKPSRQYQWEMDRCRNEKAKAMVVPNEQLLTFAQSMLDASIAVGCDKKETCKGCPLIVAPKVKIQECKPVAFNLDALTTEFEDYKTLRDAAQKFERLNAKKIRLSTDQRSKLIYNEDIEKQKAAVLMAQQIEILHKQEKALIRVRDLDVTIEKIRLEKIKVENLSEKAKKSENDLKKIRKDLAIALFNPIQKAVNKHLPFQDAFFGFDANDKLLIGWKLRESVVARDSLSAGEQAQFDVAMALGTIDLLNDNKPKIITIEAAEISHDNLIKFCESLNKAPDNVQIIIATWTDCRVKLPEIENFDIVNLVY